MIDDRFKKWNGIGLMRKGGKWNGIMTKMNDERKRREIEFYMGLMRK